MLIKRSVLSIQTRFHCATLKAEAQSHMANVRMANRHPARLRTKPGQCSVLLSGVWDWNKQPLKEANISLFFNYCFSFDLKSQNACDLIVMAWNAHVVLLNKKNEYQGWICNHGKTTLYFKKIQHVITHPKNNSQLKWEHRSQWDTVFLF